MCAIYSMAVPLNTMCMPGPLVMSIYVVCLSFVVAGPRRSTENHNAHWTEKDYDEVPGYILLHYTSDNVCTNEHWTSTFMYTFCLNVFFLCSMNVAFSVHVSVCACVCVFVCVCACA